MGGHHSRLGAIMVQWHGKGEYYILFKMYAAKVQKRALTTQESMRSKDAQCITAE